MCASTYCLQFCGIFLMAAKVIILSLFCFAVVQSQVDLTLVPNASGSDVVKAVVSKIETARLFPTDHRLLRRIAYVESLDGEDTRAFRDGYHGGIWQVNRATLIDTQNLSAHPGLDSLYDKVQAYFGIDWRFVTWEDLRMPLYSGLAARIYLWSVGGIPLAGEIDAQATYWRTSYNGTAKDFATLVKALEKDEECNIDVDLIFVLDSSGSIGRGNFQSVREFVNNFIMSGLTIREDEDQVGVIVFSDSAQVVFNLNAYQNQAQLLSAVDSIPYIAGGTNTDAALRQLIDEGFTVGGGARLDSQTVLRVAIVMTDGKSNDPSDTLIAAAHVHEFNPAILVYVVGVTDSVNQEELNAIATSPELVAHLESFDNSLLTEYQEEQSYEICVKASSPVDVGEALNGTLEQGEQARFQLDIPVVGLTIHLHVEAGRVVMYASTEIPNPNSALHDWKLDCLIACDFFVDPQGLDIVQTPVTVDNTEQQPQVNESSNLTNFTLFLVTEGKEENTSFMVDTTFGDTSTPKACEPSCTCTNSTELRRLSEAVEQLEKGFDTLHRTTNRIYTLLTQQNEEVKEKLTEVGEKLESVQEDIRILQDSNDDLFRRHLRDDAMEIASTEQGLSSINPCIRQAERSNTSGFYWTRNTIGHPVPVYCDMDRVCCGESGAWMRVAHINMTDSTHSCPYGFSVINTAPRRCYGSSSSGCRSVIFPLHGIEYQKVCGRIIGYQYGDTDAFHGGTHSIDEAYVDGISVTYGGPSCNRKHIWTFAAAADEVRSDSSRCPCSRTNRLYTGRIPEYVNDDYFCDSGSRTTATSRTFYGADPLWDGSGCGIRSACCRFNTPPWFCRVLPEPTIDNIEVRLCGDSSSRYEAVYFELIELYVK